MNLSNRGANSIREEITYMLDLWSGDDPRGKPVLDESVTIELWVAMVAPPAMTKRLPKFAVPTLDMQLGLILDALGQQLTAQLDAQYVEVRGPLLAGRPSIEGMLYVAISNEFVPDSTWDHILDLPQAVGLWITDQIDMFNKHESGEGS